MIKDIKRTYSRPYKIDTWALRYEEVRSLIDKNWYVCNQGSTMFRISRQLTKVKLKILQWTKKKTSKMSLQWDDFNDYLRQIENGNPQNLVNGNEVRQMRQLVLELRDQHAYWKQSLSQLEGFRG